MEATKKACIINVALGGWYWKGQERLVKSLNYHGWLWDILTWKDEWPNDNYDKSCPYNAKAAAFEEAIKQGYEIILWADCSFWAIQDPNKLMDVINSQGYYMTTSGHNCAQTCSDLCLEYFGVTRDEAEKFNDCSSGLFGVNIENPTGKKFIDEWILSAKMGAFKGSREHDGQSKDPRFLFHRQDQSCASVIAGKLGMTMYNQGVYMQYYEPNMSPSVIFTLRGM